MEILIEKGTIHELPDDMKDMLSKNNVIVKQWNNLTPLARNERICRVTIVKKPETRASHIQRLCEDLLK